MTEQSVKRSSPPMIALAWAIVVIPTAWGFSYTLANAMKIFMTPTAGVAQPK
jgi:hypothetical protein